MLDTIHLNIEERSILEAIRVHGRRIRHFHLCESNGVCEGLVPEVFRINDDDELDLLQERPDESLRAKVQDAVRSCPKQALSIEED